ncbi:hypothetical protein F0562_024707 [Nyssa sinensis]|uniref:PGG domain-containing protein n=1 Tax=Nyssa sinensis TaxID=561372 RepID=A0A5J5BCJ4_9ASTE|nr:hypothetical protein F0562_024707 [Nyssa sinensis]
MDLRLTEAIVRNDTTTFISLVQENESILEQRTANSMNTVLHLASRFGHPELVKEIVKLRPEMAMADNKKLETPLHEACRRGNENVLMLLLQTNPWVASKLNFVNQSALFIACSYGHLNVVNVLLNQSWLLDLDDDGDGVSSLHIAASKGRTDIVRKILDMCPNFAQKVDKNGFSPLHYACSRGHLEISTMLVRVNQDLALQFDNNGHTPLHLAAMNGNAAILKEFISIAPSSFHLLTKEGETVFHLIVRFNRYDAFICLAQVFKDTDLLHQPDQYGNTILHLAVTGGRYHIAEFIINEMTKKINFKNARGCTALDILDEAGNTSKTQNLKGVFRKAGGKRSTELSSITVSVEGFGHQPPNLERPSATRAEEVEMLSEFRIQLGNDKLFVNNEVNNQPIKHMPTSETETQSRVDLLQHQIGDTSDIPDDDISEPDTSSRRTENGNNRLHQHRHQSQKHRKELMELYKIRHEKQHKIYREALQNARNTIILVAILIATVTFSAGTNPPRGVHPDKDEKSMFARTKAFNIFTVSNSVALFVSLSIVIVLVSIIPFRRKPLMRLLATAHKVMWVAVSFMATAYVAAIWLIITHDQEMDWILEDVILFVCPGILGSVFIYLVVMLVRHQLRKLKWRKEKRKLNETAKTNKATAGNKVENQSNSSNSDVDSSLFLGYHAY